MTLDLIRKQSQKKYRRRDHLQLARKNCLTSNHQAIFRVSLQKIRGKKKRTFNCRLQLQDF